MESAEEPCRDKERRSIGSWINADVQNLRKAHKSEVGISLSIIPHTNCSLSYSPSAHPYQIPEIKVTSQIKSFIKSQLLPQFSYDFAMSPSNPGQEPCHTLHTVPYFLDRHKPKVSPIVWVLQTHPQLWKQKLPMGLICPMCHSNCTSTGAFFLKFIF